MDLFDPRFVSFIWDSSLSGLKGFFAQDIGDLQKFVNENIRFDSKTGRSCFGPVEQSGSETSHPFDLVWYLYRPTVRMCSTFRFFYHDPCYDVKRAWLDGFTIECRVEGFGWFVVNKPCWDSNQQYQVSPPDAFVTNHEIALWVGHGKGELLLDEEGVTSYHGTIHDALKSAPIVGVRRWGETTWHSPTRAYLNS